jgi:hypothetical protein
LNEYSRTNFANLFTRLSRISWLSRQFDCHLSTARDHRDQADSSSFGMMLSWLLISGLAAFLAVPNANGETNEEVLTFNLYSSICSSLTSLLLYSLL